MFKNYFKTAVRNLMQHKTYTGINVFGLAIAFVCSILLFLNARLELSYDDFYSDQDRIFKIYKTAHNTTSGIEKATSMAYPVAPTLKSEIPEVKAASRYFWGSGSVEYNGKKIEVQTNLVDNDFFEIFSLSVIKGNKNNPLSDIGNVVISEYAAKLIFNKEDPIGKLLKVRVDDEWKELMVGSVVKNSPNNSSIVYDVLLSSQLGVGYTENKNNWNNSNHDVYIKLAGNASQQSVEDKCRLMLHKYNATDSAYMKDAGYIKDEKGDYQSMRLLPLKDLHFDTAVGSGRVISKTYVYTILLISFFILMIACFNFINLNIARSFTRAKEVGVRKSLGADRKQIFLQIWGESLFVCTISLVIGVFLAIFLFPSFNKIFGAQLKLDFFYQPGTLMVFILGVMLVSLIAGGYPALVVSRLNAVSVLKGTVSIKKPGIFRNALIIFQFTIACFLMSCTLIAYNQFEFMRTMPLGFDKESVISLPLSNTQKGRTTLTKFRERLASNPAIVSVSGANMNIGLGKDGSRSKSTTGFVHNGKGITTNWMTVDYDFLKTLGVKLLNGRDFSKAYGTDSINAVLVTESIARQFGEKEVVGLTFSTDTLTHYSIVGVIADFHLYSLHNEMEPLTIDISNSEPIRYIFIKTNSKNPLQTMGIVEKLYKELEPGKEFKATFLDENTNNWYKDEKKLSMLLAICSVVAIVLSCLGLFALALLMIRQRIKEIGVRKVLGASVFKINVLLVKDFLKLVFVAILAASPLAWWAMGKWLQDFPYRTTIHFWLFLSIGIIAVLIALLTVSFHTIRAAMANPVKSLRTE